MNNRTYILFSMLALMSFLIAMSPGLAAQQSGIDFRSQQYSAAISEIVTLSDGRLSEEDIIYHPGINYELNHKSFNNSFTLSDLFFVYPEIILVSHDGNESALFNYFIWIPQAVDSSLTIDFTGTPDWVDTASLTIDFGNQQFTIDVLPNPEPLARVASIKASGIVNNLTLYSTAYILQAPAPQAFIIVTPNFLAVLPDGGTTPPFTVIHFNLDEGWEAVFTEDWIAVDSTTLTTNSISFLIAANATSNTRMATIEIRAVDNPEIKDIITIFQYAAQLPYLVVSPKNSYVDPEGGDVEVLVFTNLESWNTQILENPGGMIAETTQSPGGDSLTISVVQNPTANQRMASVVISGGEPLLSDTIRIYQSAPYIILNPREKLVACTGSNFGVNVIRYGVNEIVFSGNPDWVSVNIINNDSIHIAVEPNPTDQTRTGIVIISSTSNPSVSDQVQIIQYACTQPYIILSPHQQVANWNDTILSDPFIITSNNTGELSASTSALWLDAIIDGDSLFVTLDINESNTLRSAVITVFDITNPALSDAVTVIQAGTQTFILVTPGFQSIPHTGGLTDPYTVFSLNVEEWEVHFESIPPWITDTQIAGNQIIFNLAANGTPDLRQATFRVRDVSNPELYAEALILQEAATESLLFLSPRHKQLPHTANPLVNFQVTALNVELWQADATSVPEWISVNSSDQSTLSLNVAENTLPETRLAIIRIYDTSNPAINDSVFIFQYSALNSYLLAAPREQWVPHEGNDDLHFLITAVNVENWEADLDGIDWIAQNTSGPDTLSLSVSENTLPETRSAIIFLYDTSNPAVKDSVFVFQYSAIDSYLLAAPREQVVGHMGNNNVEFQVTTVNVDEWEYDPATVPSWISVTNSGEELLALSIEPNESMQIRQATIRIFATNQSDIEDFVSIYQLAGTEAYLIALPRTRLVPHYGNDEVDFTISMVNVEGWEFTNTAPYEDWIDFYNIGDSIMRLTVDTNFALQTRLANIVIQATEDNSVKDSVTVFQFSGLDRYIIAEPRELMAKSYETDTLVFSLLAVNVSSLAYEVIFSTDPDMIDDESSFITDDQLSIIVNPNESLYPREARIRIFDAIYAEVADTVSIYQSFPGIILRPASLDGISWAETIFKLNTISNVSEFLVSKGEVFDWYQLSKDAVSWSDDPLTLGGNDSLYVRVQENTSAFQKRSSYLSFKVGGETINQFWFSQDARPGSFYTLSGGIFIDGDLSKPLAGVQVAIYDAIKTTNANGLFMHENIPENWTGTITPLIDASLPFPYYFYPPIIEISGSGVTGDTVVGIFSAFSLQPNLSIFPKTITICTGQVLMPGDPNYPNISLNNTFGPTSFLWTSDPHDDILAQNPFVMNPQFGPLTTTTYRLEVDNLSRIAVDSFTIVVNPLPSIAQTEGPFSVCRNQAGVVYQVSDPQPGVSYLWKLEETNPGGAIVNGYNPLFVSGNIAIVNWGNAPGTYLLTLLAYNQWECAAIPQTMLVEINNNEASPPTTVERKRDDNMLFTTDTLAARYQWGWFTKSQSGQLGEEYLIPGKNQWYCRLPEGHVFNTQLYYYFVITHFDDDETCVSRSFYNAPVGVEEFFAEPPGIFPNPSNGKFNLKINDPAHRQGSELEIYTTTGQLVYKKHLHAAQTEYRIDLIKQGIPGRGIYILVVRTPVSVNSSKLIIH